MSEVAVQPSTVATLASRPAIRAGIMVLLVLLSGAVPAEVPARIEALREYSLDLVNQERRQNGLELLHLDDALVKAAQSHANDMLERNYYSHVSPEGDTVGDRYRAKGGARSKLVAENIGRCLNCAVPADHAAVEQLHRGWMNSREHRENILTTGLRSYGFGIAESPDGTRYAVQTFAGPGMPRNSKGNNAADRRALDAEAQNEAFLAAINAERRERGIPPLSADQRLAKAAHGIAAAEMEGSHSPDNELEVGRHLPDRQPWRTYRMMLGSCTGCGTEIVQADIQFFIRTWRDQSSYRHMLFSPDLTHVGFFAKPDGQGRKVAVALLAG